jgi:hypothetical protein
MQKNWVNFQPTNSKQYPVEGRFHDQAEGGRPENRHLKGCLTENFLLQIESIYHEMFKNASS